jgi:pimeloyl-ACP methyl ester carboxylesterase
MNANAATVVLVHAAWADETSWAKVVRTLNEKGIRTVTPRLPLSTLAGDVAALDQALANIEGPVVLVGHAYSGAVIGATRSAKVKALVYVAGLAPDQGETVAEVFNRYGHDDKTPQLAPDEKGLIWLPREAFGIAFAPHATPAEQQELAAKQLPISPASITVPVDEPLWKHVPAWYLLAQHDHMIPEQTQRFVAERMHARISAHPVDHVPMVSAPEHVEQLILDALQHIRI